jgi:hypothetical protein
VENSCLPSKKFLLSFLLFFGFLPLPPQL